MDDKSSFSEQIEKAWGQALLAVSSAEDEAARLLRRWTNGVGGHQEEVKRWVRETSQRIVEQRRDLEKTLEERLSRTVSRFRSPKRDEVQMFQRRLDSLAARIQALSGEGQ